MSALLVRSEMVSPVWIVYPPIWCLQSRMCGAYPSLNRDKRAAAWLMTSKIDRKADVSPGSSSSWAEKLKTETLPVYIYWNVYYNDLKIL